MAEKKINPLLCKQCGYANEGERVYCHNCGTKLDRSLLPSSGAAEETLAKKQKRIRKIVTPKSGFFAGAGKSFVYSMLCALVAAGLILVLLPPDDVPKPGSDELSDNTPSMALEDAEQANTPTKLPPFTQAGINSYLQSKIKGVANGALGDSVKFERVFVILDEDRIRITTEQKVFGHSVYCSIYYRLAIVNNKLQSTILGGNFGRLPIHPNLMKNLGSIFQRIWDADEIKRDKRLLDHCQSVAVHKGEVDVVTLPETTQ